MADKKITQFDTFEGTADSGVFFVVASGDASNPLSKNYRFPFDKLASDVIGANSPWKFGDNSIYTLTGAVGMGTSTPGYQLDVATTGRFRDDLIVSGDLYVSGTTHVQKIIDASITGTISGVTGEFADGIFADSLTISGVSVSTGMAGKWEEDSPGSIRYEGAVFTEDVFDCANLYLQNQDGVVGAALRASGFSFMRENVAIGHDNPSARLHVTGGKILAPSGDFSESLTISGVSVATGMGGKWEDGASAGDIYYDEGAVFIGDSTSTVGGQLFVTGGDGRIVAPSGDFSESLTISGVTVSTGAGGGGKWIDDPAYPPDGITYEDGPVGISGDLRVSGDAYFTSSTIFVGDHSIKAADDYLIISGSGIKVGDPGLEEIVLTTEKLGLGTTGDLAEEPGDINFKLLTDQNRFVIGTTGQPGGDLSGWYRFNDYTVKGATDIGAHIMNPIDSRIYTEGSSFMLLTEDSNGAPIGYLGNSSGALSANNQISIGISAKIDETETPRDLEFTDADGEVYSVINGDSDSVGANGLPISQGLQAPSMGANPATLLIDGGYF